MKKAVYELRQWLAQNRHPATHYSDFLQPMKLQVVFRTDSDAYAAQHDFMREAHGEKYLFAADRPYEIDGVRVEFVGPTIRIER